MIDFMLKRKTLEISKLQKTFGFKEVLNEVSFSINEGESVAYIGKNGSGKSTTFRCITGEVLKDEGRIEIYGIDIDKYPIEAKKELGYLQDDPFLYPYLTGLEHLYLWRGFRQLSNNYIENGIALADQLELDKNMLNELTKNYSRGMCQKIALIGVIFHKPKLIILDEPFTAMDTSSTYKAVKILKRLVEEGCSLLFASHDLKLIKILANFAFYLENGRVSAKGDV